jgi:hypothetical protein
MLKMKSDSGQQNVRIRNKNKPFLKDEVYYKKFNLWSIQ